MSKTAVITIVIIIVVIVVGFIIYAATAHNNSTGYGTNDTSGVYSSSGNAPESSTNVVNVTGSSTVGY